MGVPWGTFTEMLAAVAVQPITLDGTAAAVQPCGHDVTESLTRSKNVELRATLIGTVAVAPASALVTAVEPALSANVPREPIFDTSSSGSWVESGSVDVFQLRFPR